MWIFIDRGFISAVEFRDDSTKILARARVKQDLEQLREAYPELAIFEDKSADYRWRSVLPRTAFSYWLANAALDIDYDGHFKEVMVERSYPHPQRYSALLDVWTSMYRLQGKVVRRVLKR